MRKLAAIFIILPLLFCACVPDEQVNTPRPRGYFRIALPDKNYIQCSDSTLPYTMEIPDYSMLFQSSAPNAPSTWKDLFFGDFQATLYLSYNEITSDSLFAELVNQSWEMTEAHQQMSQAMKDTIILRPDAKVYGTVIELGGNAASLLQFYMTDSTKNFLRGSLYFYAVPNKDSLQPVVDYIKKDIFHLVETLQWETPAESIMQLDVVPEIPEEDKNKLLKGDGNADKYSNLP